MRILLAEDEKALSKVIIKILEKNNKTGDETDLAVGLVIAARLRSNVN